MKGGLSHYRQLSGKHDKMRGNYANNERENKNGLPADAGNPEYGRISAAFRGARLLKSG